MSRWNPATPLLAVWNHLNDYARKPTGTFCPACERKVQFRRRRINQHQAETFVAICREHYLTRSQSRPRPWIHVEHELVAKGHAPRVGGDWSYLRFWGLIEPKPDPEKQGSRKAGYWRPTEFGLVVFERPRGELLREYVLTFNNRKRGEDGALVSLVSRLGKSTALFDEIRRAS